MAHLGDERADLKCAHVPDFDVATRCQAQRNFNVTLLTPRVLRLGSSATISDRRTTLIGPPLHRTLEVMTERFGESLWIAERETYC